jgi:hypothetical protein
MSCLKKLLTCSLENTGDVNGDGFDNLIIGADGNTEIYIVYGSDSKNISYVILLKRIKINQSIITALNRLCDPLTKF